MSRYCMHLKDGRDTILDPDGVELPDEIVESVALSAARDCMSGDVKDGKLDLRYRIEVEDEHGAIVHQLDFADAVEIIAEG